MRVFVCVRANYSKNLPRILRGGETARQIKAKSANEGKSTLFYRHKIFFIRFSFLYALSFLEQFASLGA